MSEPTLDEVLSDDYTVEMADTGEAEVEQVEADTPEPVETEAIEAPPTSDSEKDNRIDPEQFKGYLDERDKRQKLEAEIEVLRKQNSVEPQAKIDPIDDPEGFQNDVDRRINQAVFKQELKWMKRTHEDWDAAETWINDQLGDNIAMQGVLSASDNLLEDSYKMYQDHIALQTLQGAGDANEALTTANAKIAELEARIAGKVVEQKDQTKAAAVGKPSLAETGNSTGGVSAEGLMSLEDMLGRDFNHRPN